MYRFAGWKIVYSHHQQRSEYSIKPSVTADIAALKTMLWCATLVALSCLVKVQAADNSARIVIVGAGASGIAAAARLMENGFNNISVLEAENRIGGRIFTTDFAGYVVDVGGQWVHGEEDNAVYQLAWPLGVLDHSHNPPAQFFSSSGPPISEGTGSELMALYVNITGSETPDEYLNKSSGEYYQLKFDEHFRARPAITEDQRKSLTNMFVSFDMALNAADSWYNISVNREEKECRGDYMINWKTRGYNTILDILMKRFPNASQELPVLNNTILNTEVRQINYNSSGGPVRIITANGDEYLADHVIVTTSIGVLKADYKTMFNPSLPEVKINAIERAQLGSATKILLHYDDPWWVGSDGKPDKLFNFYWTENDRKEVENNPEKSWILGLVMAFNVEHKPNLLLCWVTGPSARLVETLPEDLVFAQVKEFFHRFLGRAFNVTEPSAMLRSQWFANKHFRGTWSYRSPEFETSGSKVTDLSEPIIQAGKPVILFAGEVTHPVHPSTVHGAIVTGWREADRLIKLYSNG